MHPDLAAETRGLHQAWDRHDASMLRDYLVQAEQDPRINAASILARHFLIERLAPGRFADIEEAELEFSMVLNWVLRLAKSGLPNERLGEIQYALMQGDEAADDIPIPRWVTETVARLTDAGVPSYLGEALVLMAGQQGEPAIPESVLNLLVTVWRRTLDGLEVPARKPSVLEPACGSANDYRFLAAAGLARLVEYTGLDLCEKNVENARRLFPGVRFQTGNVFELPLADRSFDFTVAQDLLEHLSPAGLETAVAEICRVTRKAAWVGFFQMHDGPDHVIRPYGTYHVNTLSAARTRDLFLRHAAGVEVVPVASVFRDLFGCDYVSNPAAYVLTATMEPA